MSRYLALECEIFSVACEDVQYSSHLREFSKFCWLFFVLSLPGSCLAPRSLFLDLLGLSILVMSFVIFPFSTFFVFVKTRFGFVLWVFDQVAVYHVISLQLSMSFSRSPYLLRYVPSAVLPVSFAAVDRQYAVTQDWGQWCCKTGKYGVSLQFCGK